MLASMVVEMVKVTPTTVPMVLRLILIVPMLVVCLLVTVMIIFVVMVVAFVMMVPPWVVTHGFLVSFLVGYAVYGY